MIHSVTKRPLVLNNDRFLSMPIIRDRTGTPKNLCNKDFADFSGELSGAICLRTLVLLGSALELFTKFFCVVRAIFWLWVLLKRKRHISKNNLFR